MPGKVLMIQGTMSSAGKSLLVTGLCRIYARRGWHVAPFKAQNMSNNAAVCADGSEIGRAQFTQAQACGIEPLAVMNPVLLKPETDSRSQIILKGCPWITLPAQDYYLQKETLWQTVTQSLDELRRKYQLVVIEGAGSPAEINLKRGDIVNMAVAKYTRSPVLLVGDIDRGGIFAQLLGTLWLLEDDERALVRGLLVNKFRGDMTLFSDGVRILEEKGEVPVLGVIPYVHHHIPEEDAVALEEGSRYVGGVEELDIAVIHLPRISNFDDFDPLENEQHVSVRYVDSTRTLGKPDALIIPGTKSTIADLNWLTEQGLSHAVLEYARQGGAVVGLCGGYQMLGRSIKDPHHVESQQNDVPAIGLLDVETVFDGVKMTCQTDAEIRGGKVWLEKLQGHTMRGYEIHNGSTNGERGVAWLKVIKRNMQSAADVDGAVSEDGRVWGCYLHGIFENDIFRRAWLASLGWKHLENEYLITPEESINHFADVMETALDMPRLDALIGL